MLIMSETKRPTSTSRRLTCWRERVEVPEAQPVPDYGSANRECKCKPVVGRPGRYWENVNCPYHGRFKENLYFSRKAEPTPRKGKRAGIKSY
jgi:hypothetical protein